MMYAGGCKNLDYNHGDSITIPCYLLIAKYLNRVEKQDFEIMSKNLISISENLYKKKIIVPFDFEIRGSTCYSECLYDDITFLQAAGIIDFDNTSKMHRITSKGKKIVGKKDWLLTVGVPNKVTSEIESSIAIIPE